MRRFIHALTVGFLCAGIALVILALALLTACRGWPEPPRATPTDAQRLRANIVEVDMGDGVRCYARLGNSTPLSCVYVPPDADCWPGD